MAYAPVSQPAPASAMFASPTPDGRGSGGAVNFEAAGVTSGNTTGSYVTLVTLAITITGTRIVADGLIEAIKNTNTGTIWLRLQVDGVTAAEGHMATTSGFGVSIPIRAVVTGLSAGSRTVTLQWRHDTAGASTSYALLTAEEK